MSFFTRTSAPKIVCALMLAVTFTPVRAAAQDKATGRSTLNLLQDSFVNIADEVEPTVVTVTARRTIKPRPGATAPDADDDILGGIPLNRGRQPRSFRAQGTGTGVILSTDGWILTNDHVIGGADKVTIKLHDGREFDGIVRRDYRSDLALVKINASDLRPARLGDSDKTKIGQWAIAIGSPYRYEGSFSVGVISSLLRKQEISSSGNFRLYPSMIQTDAAINPGNSGGPLVNIDGEVVGINTAIESEGGGSVGIGFAIPINAAKFVIEELKAKGKVTYGYLGVNPDTITPRLAMAYRVSDGALVQDEPPADSPAANCGIHAGDVITEIDGKPIHSELDLRSTVARMRPGTKVNIALVRDGTEKRVKAEIAELPAIQDPEAPALPAKPTLGIEAQAISADLARKAGLNESAMGVVVKSIDGGSPAGESEIRVGDVILKINDSPITNLDDFKKASDSLKTGEVVRILWAGRRGPGTTRRVANVKMD